MQQCNKCASQTCNFHASENRTAYYGLGCVIHRDAPPKMFDGVDMSSRCKNYVPLPRLRRSLLEAAMSSSSTSNDAVVTLLRRFCLIKAFQKQLVKLNRE